MSAFAPPSAPTPGSRPSAVQPSTLEILKTQFAHDLQAYLALCEEALAVATRENAALASPAAYQPAEFRQRRQDLVPRLDRSLKVLRDWRQRWQQLGVAHPGGPEARSVFQAVPGLLMQTLLLDRDNQQALLQRGLLPAEHLPTPAAQQRHCVSDLYRRHARPQA